MHGCSAVQTSYPAVAHTLFNATCPPGLLLLRGTASLMDQSQRSAALEWRDRTIPRWPDSFPGSYGFPKRAWIFEKHSSVALEWNINPRECGPSKQAQGGYAVLQMNEGAPEGSWEYLWQQHPQTWMSVCISGRKDDFLDFGPRDSNTLFIGKSVNSQL